MSHVVKSISVTRLFCITLILLIFAGVTSAQEATDAVDIDSEAALARLSDTEVRRLLIDRLEADKQQSATPRSEFNPAITALHIQRNFGVVRARLMAILGAWANIPAEVARAWQKLTAPRDGGSFAGFVLSFLLAIGVGLAAEWAIRNGLGRLRRDLTQRVAESLGQRAKILATVLIMRLASLAVFLTVVAATFFVLASNTAQNRTTFFFYLSAVAIVRFVSALTAVFVAPRYPQLRLPQYTDRQATALHRGLTLATVLAAFGFFTCALFGTLGVAGNAHPLLLLIVGTSFVAAWVVTVFVSRRALVHDFACRTGETNLRSLLAHVCPWIMMFAAIAIWAGLVYVSMLGGTPRYGAGILTIFVLLFLPAADAALEREAARGIAAGEDIAAAIARVTRIVLIVAAVALLASAWRVDLLSIAEGGLGALITRALLQIGAVLLVAYTIWQGVRIWIDRRIAAEDVELGVDAGNPSDMEIGGEGMSRTRTLLPLLRMTVRITLSVIVIMIVLSSLGVDIGPVLAGVGVVGLAIGIGSQTLVRDIVSGVFFLVDDAFRLSEYVDVGDVKGTVEKISIRSLRLRHHRGAVHTVPFGEIATLTNYSRDWAIMKLKFRVPFDTDVEKVRKLLKKVGQGLLEHPEVGEDFLQPFKSQGVMEVDDYGLVLRAKFMCKPGRQFMIRRYAYVAVQQAFAENGIDFAQPEIRVLVGDDDDPESGRKQAVAGAAAQGAIAQSATANPVE